MTTSSLLRDRLRTALLVARRARDTETVTAVRTVLAALENAEAVPHEPHHAAGAIEQAAVGVGAAEAERRVLDHDEELGLLDAEIADLRAAARTYDELGRADHAGRARRAAEALAALR